MSLANGNLNLYLTELLGSRQFINQSISSPSITSGDILENFCLDDDLANVARLSFAVIVMMTYPLDCFVAREVSDDPCL